MRGSGLGCRTPTAWGAQHWGHSPHQWCLPAPSQPSHHRGTSPRWEGGEATLSPLPTLPCTPRAPPAPLSTGAMGLGGAQCPSSANTSSATPNPPQTRLGDTGNQVLLVKLGPPVKAPPASTAWGKGPVGLRGLGWCHQGRDGTGVIGMCLTWGTATPRLPCALGTHPGPPTRVTGGSPGGTPRLPATRVPD